MKPETREVLSLFIEKANKLLSMGFAQSVIDGTSYTVSWKSGEGTRIDGRGLTEEEVDAFLLTFRFFIQGRDGISFRALNDDVLMDPGLSVEWKTEFSRVRQELNAYLDHLPSVRVVINGNGIKSRREVLNVFLYGDLAHVDPKRRAVFATWKRNRLIISLLRFQFVEILAHTLDAVALVSKVTEQELGQAPRTSESVPLGSSLTGG